MYRTIPSAVILVIMMMTTTMIVLVLVALTLALFINEIQGFLLSNDLKFHTRIPIRKVEAIRVRTAASEVAFDPLIHAD